MVCASCTRSSQGVDSSSRLMALMPTWRPRGVHSARYTVALRVCVGGGGGGREGGREGGESTGQGYVCL
jgi:hypothetical protein